jgi:hypothetical protein
MTTEKRKLIRLAGVTALICAAVVFAADVVMLGLPVSGAEINDYRVWSKIPEWRLRVGGYGAFVISALAVGVWQLYEGIKSAGARWAMPPFLLLSNFFITGSIYHYLFVFVAATTQAQAQMQSPDYEIMETLIQKMQDYMRLPYYHSSRVNNFRLAVVFRSHFVSPDSFPALDGIVEPGFTDWSGVFNNLLAASPICRLSFTAGRAFCNAGYIRRVNDIVVEYTN